MHTKVKGVQFCIQGEGSLVRKSDKHLNSMCCVCSTVEGMAGVREGTQGRD